MKRKFLFGALAIVMIAGVLAWPVVARMRENARRARAIDGVPQSQRALRVPSPQVLQEVLPGAARTVLERSSNLTLYSVEPRENWAKQKPDFHFHTVLGQTIISQSEAKRALLASLYDGFLPVDAPGMMFGCFQPRHGLRATLNGKKVDLLICFSCHQFELYVNDHKIEHSKFVTGAPRPLFNATLTAANVPLAR